jgi:hypothetical protein
VSDYAIAIETESLDGLRRVYPGMTSVQARGWEQFFQVVRDVKARLSVCRPESANGTLDAQITGAYDYLNTSTGTAESRPVSFHASFKRIGGQWRISQVR